MDPTRSLVNHAERFCVWFHPKCASTTIKHWFCLVAGLTPTWEPNALMVYRMPIHRYVERFRLTPDNPCEDYFHFTVVRHPLARLVSHYRQQIQGTPAFSLIATRSTGGQIYDTFRDFAELVLLSDPQELDPHVAPMWPALEGVGIDTVLTTDTMNQAWNELPIQGNVPLPDNGRRDTDPVSCCVDWGSEKFLASDLWPPWRCYYDRDLQADASRYFAHDIERWFS